MGKIIGIEINSTLNVMSINNTAIDNPFFLSGFLTSTIARIMLTNHEKNIINIIAGGGS